MPILAIYPFTPDPKGVPKAVVPIKIINPYTNASLFGIALLDTGASCCVFPSSIPQFTGHNLKGAGVQCKIITGVGAEPVNTWCHTFEIELLNANRKTIVWKSDPTLIHCLDYPNAPILIGVNNFLHQFSITFNYRKQEVIISQ